MKTLKYNFNLLIDRLFLATLVMAPLSCVLGRWFWVLDLANHFRIPLILGMLPVSLWFLYRQHWKRFIFSVAMFFYLGSSAAPYFFATVPESNTGIPDLKIFYANVYTVNRKHDLLIHAALAKNPDIIVLLETNPRWFEAVKKAFVEYRYTESELREDNFGIAVFSKIPMSFELFHSGERQIPSIRAEFQLKDKPAVLWALHPQPPKSGRRTKERNQQLAALGETLKKEQRPVLVAADLNTSPWSNALRLVLTDKMQDSRWGFGLGLSWPAILPKFFRTPIDYILHSPEFKVLKYQVLDSVGSDHLPVYAELKLEEI